MTESAGLSLTYREAVSLALSEEMRNDEHVLLLGEDVGREGGVFKLTDGLYGEFGPRRVWDTPISEMGFVGAALGLAVTGFRPVVEIMFTDFLGVCFDQVINQIAKHRFMSGGRMCAPLVIRAVGGGGLQFGAQHSATGESWLIPFPGLKILLSSTPQSAYDNLRRAIRDPDPVVVLEHKGLLGMKGTVVQGAEAVSAWESGHVVRAGKDITLVASLAMVSAAQTAAQALSDRGIEAEVIDLCVLRPFRPDSIQTSVKKTGRLLCIEEQVALGGWGAQLISSICENDLDALRVAPARITMPDHPLPYSDPLETAAIPTSDEIVERVERMVA